MERPLDSSPRGGASWSSSSWAKALRAQQLYDENNPVYQRFVSQLGEALGALWVDMDRLPISVEENRFTLDGGSRSTRVTPGPIPSPFFSTRTASGSSPSIKDWKPTSSLSFLQVLNRARDLRPEGDDLLTILWEKDLKYFTYSYIDVLAEGVDLDPSVRRGESDGGVREDRPGGAGARRPLPKPGRWRGKRRRTQGVAWPGQREDFNPTLYSLDPTGDGEDPG